MRELKFRAWDKVNKIYTYATLGDLICGACTESGDIKDVIISIGYTD